MGDSAPDSRVAHLDHARNTPPGHNFNNHNATTTDLPNSMSAPIRDMSSVAGMVDLPTLAKMFEVLSTSQDDDDRNLAAWINANYLPRDFDGVIEQGGAAIKGTEGFAKLYNAYKRVRTLTNRAQDKWPFFDRRWKSMTSAQVTKMATRNDNAPPSNASPGLLLESPLVRSLAENGPAAPTAEPQAQGSSTALDQAATNQPAATGTTEPEGTQPTELAERVKRSPTPASPTMASARAQPHPTEGDKAASEISAISTPASVLAVESAFEHDKLDDLPTSSGGKRKRGPPDFDERGLFARGHSNLRPKRGRRGGRGRGKKPLATERADSTDGVTDHTPSTFEDMASRNGKDKEMAHAPVKKPKAAAPSPRVTRRQARLSGGSDNQENSSQAMPARAESQEASSPKSHSDSDAITDDNEQNTTMSQADKGAVITDNEDTLIPDNDSATSDITNTDLLALGLSHSERPKTEPTVSPARADQDIVKPDSKAVSPDRTMEQDTQSQKVETVNYFARVNTGTASFEVPLDDTMDDDKKLNSDLLGYAAWREKMGTKSASVSFDTWLSIFSFGR
ncbi:hypothetical protein P171DRAFT_432904 [Karstenula rhodostoma CBS 690.94]|uniref:Uncharacterized protein n=1 Tax=Karstenula rhodostoma CBS 690.94 TaxID=1392251 RepID=A0A9P4PIE0_9PLEO|nr:hypothetical protein P171DRAFT_432904 [Karstenula rhodostoma CBS 690.94]